MKLIRMCQLFLVAGLVLPLASVAERQAPDQMAARAMALGFSADTVQLTPCVPRMGEHWARLQDMPFGPIYGARGERVLFVEVMIAQADFESGQSWQNVLQSPGGQAIDHVDIHFEGQGHEGYEIPHYAVHAYYVTHDEERNIC